MAELLIRVSAWPSNTHGPSRDDLLRWLDTSPAGQLSARQLMLDNMALR